MTVDLAPGSDFRYCLSLVAALLIFIFMYIRSGGRI
jgi:hypothetical protein